MQLNEFFDLKFIRKLLEHSPNIMTDDWDLLEEKVLLYNILELH